MILVCVLLVFIPNCKKLPTTPDIESVVKAQIEYFTATPTEIGRGESSTLSWSTKNAATVTINNGIGVVSAEGEKVVSPEETTTYVLTAKNSAGETQQSCTVEIVNKAIFILQEHRRTYSWAVDTYGYLRIIGMVKNTGDAMGYDVVITYKIYNLDGTLDAIGQDLARNYINSSLYIPAGGYASFDVIFYDSAHNGDTDYWGDYNGWQNIDWSKVEYEITWLTGEG